MSPKELSASDGFCLSCSRTSSSRSDEIGLDIGVITFLIVAHAHSGDEGARAGFCRRSACDAADVIRSLRARENAMPLDDFRLHRSRRARIVDFAGATVAMLAAGPRWLAAQAPRAVDGRRMPARCSISRSGAIAGTASSTRCSRAAPSVNGMQMYVEHWIPDAGAASVSSGADPRRIRAGHGLDQHARWTARLGFTAARAGLQGVCGRPAGAGPQSLSSVRARAVRSRSADVRKRREERRRSANGRARAMRTILRSRRSSRRWGSRWATTPITQNVWRTRGAMLLDDIGPAILLTHGDGAVFAWVTAQERPDLVKGDRGAWSRRASSG